MRQEELHSSVLAPVLPSTTRPVEDAAPMPARRQAGTAPTAIEETLQTSAMGRPLHGRGASPRPGQDPPWLGSHREAGRPVAEARQQIGPLRLNRRDRPTIQVACELEEPSPP